MYEEAFLDYLIATLESVAADSGELKTDLLPRIMGLKGLNALDRDREILDLLDQISSLPEQQDIGFRLGDHLPVTSFGAPGLGAQIAPTLRDGIGLITRFHQLISPVVLYDLSERREEAQFIIGFRYPVARGEHVIVAIVAQMLDRYVSRYTGKERNFLKIELTASSTGLEASYQRRFGLRPETGSMQNALYLERATLDIPSESPDPVTFERIKTQCSTAESASGRERNLTALTKELIAARIARPPILAEIALRGGVSERQLRFSLTRSGTSYRKLVQQCKTDQALELFRNPDLTIAEIGYRLGYSDPANFSTAFYRWTGETPTKRRRREKWGESDSGDAEHK